MGHSNHEIEGQIASVLEVLRGIRINVVFEEYMLQELIAQLLTAARMPFSKEYRLAPCNRIDFLVQGGIGIEVKKGKPNAAQVYRQLERYAAFDAVQAVILVVERNVSVPDRICGKRCIVFGLNRLWGVALG